MKSGYNTMFDLGIIEVSNDPTIILRKANKINLDFIKDISFQETNRILQEAWGGKFKWDSWFDDISKAIEENSQRVFIIEFEGNIIGYLWLNEEDKSIWVTAIVINALWQRKKIGKKIMNYLMKEGRKERKEFIELGVQRNNNAAINFYLKLGFETFDHLKYANTNLLRLKL